MFFFQPGCYGGGSRIPSRRGHIMRGEFLCSFPSHPHNLENSNKTVPKLLQKIPISKYKTNYQRHLEIFETIVTIKKEFNTVTSCPRFSQTVYHCIEKAS